MPRKYIKKVKHYTEEDVEKAVKEYKESKGQLSIRSVALKYNLDKSLLSRRVLGQVLQKRGRKTALSHDDESKLAKHIKDLAKWGFALTSREVKQIVSEYVQLNEIQNPFSKNKNMPGKDWFSNFVKRHNLSIQKLEKLEMTRRTATADPFIIFGFYSVLEEQLKRLNLKGKPNQVWNLDESFVPSDPARVKCVTGKGQIAHRNIMGSGKDNTSFLACCSAAGALIAPLFIFQGNNLWTTWKGTNDLPGTMYAVSEKGYMTSEIFSSFFFKFCETVKERPLLLILDGHTTHLSVDVLSHAVRENITILKLPPHTTETLQPLDKACFKPFKDQWNHELHTWQRQNQRKITRAELVDLVCKIWHRSITKTAIIKGFASTGIFPFNMEKYPLERLDINKVTTFLEKKIPSVEDDTYQTRPTERYDELRFSFLNEFLDNPEGVLLRRKETKRNEKKNNMRTPNLPSEPPTQEIPSTVPRPVYVTEANTSAGNEPLSFSEMKLGLEDLSFDRTFQDPVLTPWPIDQPGPSYRLTSAEVDLLLANNNNVDLGSRPKNNTTPATTPRAGNEAGLSQRQSSAEVNLDLVNDSSALSIQEQDSEKLVTAGLSISPHSFEALLLSKIGKTKAPTNKRRKIDPYSRVVTSSEFIKQIREKEENTKPKSKVKGQPKENLKKVGLKKITVKQIVEKKDDNQDVSKNKEDLSLGQKIKLEPKSKKKLAFDSNSTSDENEPWIESGSSLDDVSIIGEEPWNFIELIPVTDYNPGDFVLVKFLGGKRNSTSYRYVAIIQEIYPDDEIRVMCLKNTSDKTVFCIQEDDVSTVKTSAILGKLPNPDMKGSEGRFKYVFQKPVDVFEL